MLRDRLGNAGRWRVCAEVERIPPIELQEIGDHTRAKLVQLATDAGHNRSAPAARRREDGRVHLRDQRLRDRRAKMLLRIADFAQMPQAANLKLAGLKDV